MGNTHEEADTRSTKEKSELNIVSGGGGIARGESKIYEYQQERINRKNSSQSSIIFTDGDSTLGGTLCQLIDEYESQLASKQEKVNRLNEEIIIEKEDINRLSYRVQEFKALLKEIRQQPESA